MYVLEFSQTGWSVHDSLEVSRQDDWISGNSMSSKEDDVHFTFSTFDMDLPEGIATLSFELCADDYQEVDAKLLGGSKRLDLSISFPNQGAFVMSKDAVGFQHRIDEWDNEHYFCAWEFDPDDAMARRLRDARPCVLHIAVTGFYLETQPAYPEQKWPNVSQPERPLTSLAALLTSPDSEYIILAPSMPVDEKRVLRAHRRILCQSSSYFETLLQSEFSEASILRQHNQPETICSAGSKMALGTNQTLSDREKEGASYSTAAQSIPTIRINDMTYEQLQTLLYYIYTGVATFSRRCDWERDERDAAAERGSSAAKPTRPTERTVPWWDGCLRPASAFDMYRLADKYDLDGLCVAALRHIAADISRSDLLADFERYEEISLFPKITQVYRDYCKRYKQWIKAKCANHEEIFKTFEVDDAATDATNTSAQH